MANDILEDVCRSAGLNLTRLDGVETSRGDLFYRVSDPNDKDIEFSGSRDSIMTYVLGYQAAYFKMKFLNEDMKRKIVEVLSGL